MVDGIEVSLRNVSPQIVDLDTETFYYHGYVNEQYEFSIRPFKVSQVKREEISGMYVGQESKLYYVYPKVYKKSKGFIKKFFKATEIVSDNDSDKINMVLIGKNRKEAFVKWLAHALKAQTVSQPTEWLNTSIDNAILQFKESSPELIIKALSYDVKMTYFGQLPNPKILEGAVNG